ncbi:FecR family protein [Tenacibaculum agarivorans]|uniref:FecR family protein n=1 Tax=Tenacibaculum agarivorans TaxID=1908389 RepID=UPI00094B9247|nr:FecR family protein [Tenacibaculum agarivorans]
MEKSDLIKKWLNYDLNDQELEAFKDLDDHDKLIKINNSLKKFKAEQTIDQGKILDSILSQKKQKQNPIRKIINFSVKIAAVLLVSLGIYKVFIKNDITTIQSDYADKTLAQLPDNSTINLNAVSTISFDKKNWDTKREVNLKGEAFFKVAKGSTFDVITNQGNVRVLGTEFNVKVRDEVFEVVCYEGLVSVSHKNKTVKLSPGDSFRAGNLVKNSTKKTEPSWTSNESEFISEPLINVLKEFERQYNIEIITNTIDTKQLFTGKFVHNDLDLALKSITLPLNVNYSKSGNKIVFNDTPLQ